MIYISQGHPKGIGPEVLIKSLKKIENKRERELIYISGEKDPFLEAGKSLGLKVQISTDKLILNEKFFLFYKTSSKNSAQESLDFALNHSQEHDIVATLPLTKDVLFFNDVPCLGHTEYFRKLYPNRCPSMFFYGHIFSTLLITDHIPLSKVSESITSSLIIEKVKTTLESAKKYFREFSTIVFSGLNPHAGESGKMGNEELVIAKASQELKALYPSKNFIGPESGDTLHKYFNGPGTLIVYMFHDQGLPVFKALHEFRGLNITMGLPFLRLSVDHGTAFDIAGSGRASEAGCDFMIETALKIQQR